MAVWQFVHLGTHIYGYMLRAFKTFYVDISRKIRKQYDTNKNHANFIMVSFLVYINQFLPFLISVSGKLVTGKKLFWNLVISESLSWKYCVFQCKYCVLWSNCEKRSQRKFLPLMYIINYTYNLLYTLIPLIFAHH